MQQSALAAHVYQRERERCMRAAARHDGRPGTRPIIFIDWDFFNELVTRAEEGGFHKWVG